MAIIRSIAMGKARKSAGNVTFRTVRGRTIASEKRGPGVPTRAGYETIYQFVFALTSRFVRMHRYDIDLSFDKSKYGSQGNNFQKLNKAGLFNALSPLWSAGAMSSSVDDSVINDTVGAYAAAHPTAIYRVRKSGEPTVYLTGGWSSEDNPAIPTKDLVIIVNGVSYPAMYIAGNDVPSDVQQFTFNSDIRINQLGFGDSVATGITATGTTSAGAAATRNGSLEKVNENQKKAVNWDIEPGDELANVSYLTVKDGSTVIGSYYVEVINEGGGGGIIDPTA